MLTRMVIREINFFNVLVDQATTSIEERFSQTTEFSTDLWISPQHSHFQRYQQSTFQNPSLQTAYSAP